MRNPGDNTRHEKIWERLPDPRDHISRRRPGFLNSKTGGEEGEFDFPDLFCLGGPAQRDARNGSFFPEGDFFSSSRNLFLFLLPAVIDGANNKPVPMKANWSEQIGRRNDLLRRIGGRNWPAKFRFGPNRFTQQREVSINKLDINRR